MNDTIRSYWLPFFPFLRYPLLVIFVFIASNWEVAYSAIWDMCDIGTIDEMSSLGYKRVNPRERGYHKRHDQTIGRSVPIGAFFVPPSDIRPPLGDRAPRGRV
ncbi:hypothetical protein H4582DRAFT_46574 [Lactarius indigo]|nr:hypothetical protein H4582DRAFT_46574 [Lactarius indigo]